MMKPDPQDRVGAGQVLRLEGLVEYQAEAVVSRTLAKKEGGSITVFAFDQGQALSEHTTPFDALVHVLEGAVEVTIDGTPHLLEAGEVILMPGGRPHAVQARSRFKMLLHMLRS